MRLERSMRGAEAQKEKVQDKLRQVQSMPSFGATCGKAAVLAYPCVYPAPLYVKAERKKERHV